jgi:addiction module HigA family antidote
MLKQTPLEVTPASVDTVKGWYDRNEILLVDVREVSEFEKEHIPGALLLPLSGFDPELFPTLAGKTVVLYCAIGKRSEAAGKMLLKEGHLDVVHMEGGLKSWKAAGFETEEPFLPPETALENANPAPIFLCPAPGQVLREEYLEPLGIAAHRLAERIGISETTVAALLKGDVAINAEMSLRLARFFSTAGDFWLSLQAEHDMERARHAHGDAIRKQIVPRTAVGC